MELKSIIVTLLREKGEVSVSGIAKAVGLSSSDESDRKTIQRALKSLVSEGLLKAEGAARARVYLATTRDEKILSQASATASSKIDFIRSKEGHALWQYISQPFRSRPPIGYNQNFLRSYVPNQSFYLSAQDRAELWKIGTVEQKIRPAGTYARHILNRLLIDLSWNSSRLEGNTYSLLETKRLIEDGESAIGKDIEETQMILNHKAAIEYIVDFAATEEEINSHEVRSIHALLSENLLGDPGASGRIREIIVGISGTTYMPLENPHLLKECFELFIAKLNLIEDPFEQSFFSMVHLSYLQTFEDVNKRTARIVANIPLIRKNLRPLSFADVDQDSYVKSLLGVYEKNDVSLLRDLYLWAYVRSSQKYSAVQQSMGEPNLLKLKYGQIIKNIIQTIVIEKIPSVTIVGHIKKTLEEKKIPASDRSELFKIIEIEIASLHDGNIARFKIRPSEFLEWKMESEALKR